MPSGPGCSTPPRSMDGARAAGTGEVDKAIRTATFHPQAAAFTALLKMCAKERQWEKALEVHPWLAS